VHILHALGYPIAGMVQGWIPAGFGVDKPLVPHGISTILTSPACYRFTAPTNLAKHARIAELLGASTRGLSEEEAAGLLPGAIIRLMRDVGCPNGLSAIGYSEADIDRLAEGGWQQQRLLVGSPRSVTRADLRHILQDSLVLW
jgi:alcohol dehydrogenase class IV